MLLQTCGGGGGEWRYGHVCHPRCKTGCEGQENLMHALEAAAPKQPTVFMVHTHESSAPVPSQVLSLWSFQQPLSFQGQAIMC